MSNLSFVKHVGDGVTNTFLLAVGGDNIGYLDTRDIYVYVDGVEVTFSIQPASPHLAILDEAPADGSDVLIRRQVSKTDTYSDFSRGNVFSQKNMNNSFLQTLYLSQEWLDGFLPEGSYQKQDMDFGSKFAPTNLREPVVPSDAVTKEYADVISDRVTEIENTVISGDTRFLSYTYKNGSADGGEIFLSVPYAFQSINRVYINGSNQTYGLAWDFDVNTQLIELAEELEEGDEVVIEIGFEPEKVLDNEIVSGASEIVATGTTTPRSLANRFSDVVNLADEQGIKPALVKANSTGKLLLHNEASIQILVPSDLPTLQEAVDVGHLIYPKIPVEVMIEAGHAPSSGVAVNGGDYSNITIKSEDSVVQVTTPLASDSLIEVRNAHGPTLGCLIDLGFNAKYGVFCTNSSSMKIAEGAGVRASSEIGLHARDGARVDAYNTDWQNTGNTVGSSAILAWGASVTASGSVWSNSNYYGAQAAAAGTLNVRAGVGLNCGEYGIRATNAGIVNARECNVSGSKIGVRSFDGSTINARDVIANNCENGFFAQHGSTINANYTQAMNCTSAAYQVLDSHIDCSYGNATGSAIGISALRGGVVTAYEIIAKDCTSFAAAAQNGGKILADGGADFSGCLAAQTINISSGGSIVARSANITNSSGVGVFVSQGSATVTGSDYTGTSGNWIEITSGAWVVGFTSGITTANTNISAFNVFTGANGVLFA